MARNCKRVGLAVVFWLALAALLCADWRASAPHDRWAEPAPLALGHGPAPDAGHCSLAPAAK